VSSPAGVAPSGGNSPSRSAGGLWTAPETRRERRPWAHPGGEGRSVRPHTIAATDVPVVAAGRIELLRHLREQSISHNYYRYGNLGRRASEPRGRSGHVTP